jgi:Spy/CpxP family protein refolding chaperone
MKRLALALAAALTVADCGGDPVSPSPDLALDEAAALAHAGGLVSDPDSRWLAHLHRLPEQLKLSPEQETTIRALLERFASSTEAAREALAAIAANARAAAQAGKPREEVRAILARGDRIREELHAAERRLLAAIDAVLTPEQRAWLAARTGAGVCRGVALTEAQRTEIAALVAGFREANRQDLASVAEAFQEARAAHQRGATREEIGAILDGVRAALDRIRAAERALAEAILSVLTPEQRASGCFRIGEAPRGR